MDEALVDRIYECAFSPELWPAVMDDVASLVDARGGQLFSVRGKAVNWIGSDSLNEVFREYVVDGWFATCNRGVCVMKDLRPRFLREADLWSETELDSLPIYRDFFRPRGLGWSASTGVRLPTEDNIVVTIERNFEAGPIDAERVLQLDAIRPHLARSALVSARLGLQRAQSAADALVALGLPALLLDEDGKVVGTNSLADSLTAPIQWRSGDRFALADRKAHALLLEALAEQRGTDQDKGRSIPVRGEDGLPAHVAHLVPLKRSAQEIFARSYALLMFTPVAAQNAPSTGLLRSLFDLTATEARIAQGLAKGETLEDIAEAGGVSILTVRTQMKRVREKTGCSRQAELVSLLANVTLDRGAPKK
jgi:DNA-binding CsgD family transcriptional regulator